MLDRNRLSRTFIVDAGGVGDYTAIQAAINAAHAMNPSAAEPWVVLIRPGSYTEQITLYDGVILCGWGGTPRIAWHGDYIIKTIASAVIENLTFEQDSQLLAGAIYANASAAVLKLKHVRYGSESGVGQRFLKLVAGTVVLEDCQINAGFPNYAAIEQSGGALSLLRCRVRSTTITSTPTRGVIEVSGGSQEAAHSRIEACGTASVRGVRFSAAPGASRWLACSFHSGNSTPGVDNASGGSIAATFGGCLTNVARSGAWSGLADFIVNTGV